MRSPLVAMLWENWRLTRVEAALRLGLALVSGAAALLLADNGQSLAFWFLFMVFAFFYFSMARLNGGRFMDGYKPGFPLYLLYTRPVPTGTIVGVAMVYDAVTNAALYLLTAALLELAFGVPLPLLPVAVVIVVFHLGMTCIQWFSRSRTIQWLGSMLIGWPAFFLVERRAKPPHELAFSLTEYALLLLAGGVAIAITVAGVARQRHGDAVATVPRAARSGGYPDWMVNLFRFPCPTASATRAQLWFELKSSGSPSLVVAIALAMLVPALFALSIPLEIVRPFALFSVMMFAPTLLVLGGNAFGIRRRQGRTYASAFELTQPCRTGQLAALKVLVRTVCVSAALIVVGASVWASSALIGAWGSWAVEGGIDAVPGLLQTRQEVGEMFAAMSGYAFLAHALLAFVAVAVLVALLATFAALRARYPRRLVIAGALLLLQGLVLVLWALAEQKGIASPFLVQTIFAAAGWANLVAMVLVTIYLCWSNFVQRTLTPNLLCGAVLISAAFAAAWRWLDIAPAVDIASISLPVLVPLVASMLAPWSLGRSRHA